MSRILNNGKALVVIIIILLITNISALVFFLTCCNHPEKKEANNSKDRSGFSEFLRTDIRFSAEQLKQYDSLKKEHWKQAKPLFKALNAAKDSFYIHVGDVNDSVEQGPAPLPLLDSIVTKQRLVELDMFGHFRNIRKLCTPEQVPRYDSLVQNMIKKMMNPYRKDNRNKPPEGEKKPDSLKGKP